MLQQLKNLFQKNDIALLFASTILVNAGNYGINLLLGRFLGPEQFSEAGVMATLVLILSFVAVGLQLSAAKFSAQYQGQQLPNKVLAFQAWLYPKSGYLSWAILVILLLLLLPITRFLHFQSAIPLALVFVGIPAYFHLSVSRGILQGGSHFLGFAASYQAEMWARLGFTFAFLFWVFQAQLPYTSQAIGLGFLGSFLVAFWVAKKFNTSIKETSTSPQETFADTANFYRFAGVIAAYEFSQILINNSDVLLVKHFFDAQTAGLYAAVALIGRVVFFATWTIVTLLFPKVIQLEQQGLNHRPLFWKSLGFVFAVGAGITLCCCLFGAYIMQLLFGNAYLDAAPYLWQYALSTTLFACANVFAYYFMSLNKYVPVYLSLAAGLLQIVAIYSFHTSIAQVIQVQIVLMCTLFLAMNFYFFMPKK